MKRNILLALAFTLVFAAVAAASHHEGKMKKVRHFLKDPEMAFDKMDTDGDGLISITEWRVAHKKIAKFVHGVLKKHKKFNKQACGWNDKNQPSKRKKWARRSSWNAEPCPPAKQKWHKRSSWNDERGNGRNWKQGKAWQQKPWKKKFKHCKKGKPRHFRRQRRHHRKVHPPFGPRFPMLKAVKKIHNQTIEALKMQAKSLYKREMYEEAEGVAHDIIEKEARFLSILLSCRQGNFHQAQREIRGLYRQAFNDNEYRYIDTLDMLDHLHQQRTNMAVEMAKSGARKRAIEQDIERLTRQARLLKRELARAEESKDECEDEGEDDEDDE